MKFQIRTTYNLGACIVLIFGSLAIGSAFMSSRSSTLANDAAARRYQSYLLADELRQSSDDLTRLARTYVVSGDSKWEQQYFEILDIRNGKLPRPQHYERIYWDFRAVGPDSAGSRAEAVPLLDLMKRSGFTENELAKLTEAKANSDDLVRTETIAMNMVKGFYDDGKGGFTRQSEPDKSKAQAMMHDLAYHQYKAKIMKPVNEFLVLLDQRTAAEVDKAQATGKSWLYVAMASMIALIAMLSGGLVYLRSRTSTILGGMQQVAVGIADGRLDHPVELDVPGEEGDLLRSMDRMQRQLSTVVTVIRSTADNVATASSQIAQGNQDLSQRTEQQASALQETASTMDQLNGTVRNNAENAKQAHHMAQGAADVAAQGGDVVGRVVTTMRSISDSSQKIGDIIGVIDAIAFQTNILALNAAVEAARAGEQGRGFAVVAAEVRTLARRSAEAAKEIKALISRSVAQVEQGSALVDEAGQTMTRIVGSIQHVSNIIGEIASSSIEQSGGVQQVGEAVNRMDNATQQNAALVEESAAAAEGLKTQARQLVQAVSIFS